MSRQSIALDETLYTYLVQHGVRETPQQEALRQVTSTHEMARMQIAPEQAQFMQMLVRLVGARRCIEVGTFTGYSALSIALALPADGTLVCCDISEEWTSIGRPYWEEAGVAERIDLRLAPAKETLDALLEEGVESYDFAFIDADKASYRGYFERCLQLVRPGGLIVVDNVLWGGRVADESIEDEDTEAIRSLNAFVITDQRVEVSMVPVGDGLTLARKR